MKNNKKGFTLIELLAVIVILAIIMVIAVPQILSVISDSRTSAWNDNVGMIEKALELNLAINDPTSLTGEAKLKLSELCSTTKTDVTDDLSSIVDLGATNIECQYNSTDKKATFTLTGTGQFDGNSKTIECDDVKKTCEIK